MRLDISLPDAEATLRLGAALARGIAPGRVLHLRGDLGAGKTTLVRGLLKALGHPGPVKSPSYALVEPYMLSSLHLYHFDLYRIKDQLEWLNSGFREYFNPDAACIVEWPERAGSALGVPDVEVQLDFHGEGRLALLEARTPSGEAWLSSLHSSS
jgi:tRNA threonylcarbamoyladenosine biosynthesis protein TsaE